MGQFNIPKIQAHTLEVFTDSELLASSTGHRTIKENNFRSLMLSGTEALPPNTKAEMNTNYASWRLLEKKLTTWMRKHQAVTSNLAQISLDEMSECAIYDAMQMQDRQALVKKGKPRKVFVGQPITVKFRMTNALLTEVSVSNLRLVGTGVKYTA